MNPARKAPPTDTYVGRVAARINKLRLKAGLSVPEFAEKVSNLAGESVSIPTIYAWESGKQSPKIKTLPHIAQALNVKNARNVLPPE